MEIGNFPFYPNTPPIPSSPSQRHTTVNSSMGIPSCNLPLTQQLPEGSFGNVDQVTSHLCPSDLRHRAPHTLGPAYCPDLIPTTLPQPSCSSSGLPDLLWHAVAHLRAGHALPGPTPDSLTLMLFFLAVYGVSRSVVSDSLQPCGLVARQAPLYMEFPRQEYWSGLPCPSPGNLLDPGIEPRSAALQAESLPSKPPGKPFFLAGLCSNITSSESPFWTALALCPFTLFFQPPSSFLAPAWPPTWGYVSVYQSISCLITMEHLLREVRSVYRWFPSNS